LKQPDPSAADRSAAVLIALTEHQQPELVLIRRSERLHTNPGHIAFPGGRSEQGDGNLLETALREAFEEIGLERQYFRYAGMLPRERTINGLTVGAAVGTIPQGLRFRIEKTEVAHLLCIPLARFAPPHACVREVHWHKGIPVKAPAYHYHDQKIWGITASFINKLIETLYH